MVLRDALSGIRAELHDMPWTSMSLILAWTAWWVLVGYLWAGILPRIEAQETVVQTVEERLNDNDGRLLALQVQQLEDSIFRLRVDACNAETVEGRQLRQERLQRLVRQYYNLTRQPYPMPGCSEIR